MAKTFYLRLLLAGHDDLICEVKEPVTERLRAVLGGASPRDRFFWFDTEDGRSIIFNTAHLQGVRYLWDANIGRRVVPEVNEDSNEGFELAIALCGRDVLSESPSEDPKDVYTLFWELELGNDEVATFVDVDGEEFTLVASQIVFISAPLDEMEEGRRQVAAEDGLNEPSSAD